MGLETIVLTSCQVIMLLLSGNCTLKMTAINTQGLFFHIKSPGVGSKVVWQWVVRDPGYFKLFFLASSVSLASWFIMAA